jgi:large subunit ribosomal protein L3
LGKDLRVKFFATKLGTTHYYNDKGKHQVVSVLELKKTVVGRLKSEERDGYTSLVLVQDSEKAKPNKTLRGQFGKMNPKKITEERIESDPDTKIGDEFKITDLAKGDIVKVVGTSKGKGFQGTVKRHCFQTGPKTHGSRNYRRPGSIGMTTPSRVTKGKKMAGHMGVETITMNKVKIERVDEKNNVIWVKGHIVGPNKGQLYIIK